MNTDTILVTGAGGFIGGALVAALRKRQHGRIRAIDIKPFDAWYQLFDDVENHIEDLTLREHCDLACEGICTVYNLAANMGGMGFIENNKALCMLSVLINTHLLLAARRQGVSRYFYASSACVYNVDKQARRTDIGLKETDAYPAQPEDGYGWEKLFSERMCRHFTEDFDLQTRVARLHNVYGPHGTWTGGREKAPAAICRKVIAAKIHGPAEIDIWGDGEQTRSFMYVDDCIEGISLLMKSDISEPINLGSAEMVSINQLVDAAEDIAGITLTRHYDLTAPQGVRARNSDNSCLIRHLNWEPATPLRVGLERTYAWIYDQYVAGIAAPKK